MATSPPAFNYDSNSVNALELALSPERFQPYLLRAGGSRPKAILVYERNTALSEALYGVTQAAEIALRNAIHRTMAASHGPMWLDTVNLDTTQADKLVKARFEIQKNQRPVTPGGLIAELSLGFWTSLIAARYEKALWVPYLHKAFPHALRPKIGPTGTTAAPISRNDIFEQLESIRTLRNRIAHHEPILKLDLPKHYSGTLEAIRWICPVSAQWVRSTNCFNLRLHEKPISYIAPTLPPVAASPVPGKPSRRASAPTSR